MQDHPPAPALLEQLPAWLATELRGKVPREERFGVLVAANAAAIVAREIGPDAPGPEAERERMRRLLELARDESAPGSAREGLVRAAAAIRAGRLDDHWAEAVGVLRASVRDKLAVAHPGYSDFEEPWP